MMNTMRVDQAAGICYRFGTYVLTQTK